MQVPTASTVAVNNELALVCEHQAKQPLLIVSRAATQASSLPRPSDLRHAYSGCDSCSGTAWAAATAAWAAASAACAAASAS
jgi:hypothetical protein